MTHQDPTHSDPPPPTQPAEPELSEHEVHAILGSQQVDRLLEEGRALARLLCEREKASPNPGKLSTDFFTDQLDQANRQRHLAFEAQKEADFYAARKFHEDADQLTDLVSVAVLMRKRYPHLPDLAKALSRWSEEIQEWYDAAQELARDQLKPEEMP